jgi:hypothetical protein
MSYYDAALNGEHAVREGEVGRQPANQKRRLTPRFGTSDERTFTPQPKQKELRSLSVKPVSSPKSAISSIQPPSI